MLPSSPSVKYSFHHWDALLKILRLLSRLSFRSCILTSRLSPSNIKSRLCHFFCRCRGNSKKRYSSSQGNPSQVSSELSMACPEVTNFDFGRPCSRRLTRRMQMLETGERRGNFRSSQVIWAGVRERGLNLQKVQHTDRPIHEQKVTPRLLFYLPLIQNIGLPLILFHPVYAAIIVKK